MLQHGLILIADLLQHDCVVGDLAGHDIQQLLLPADDLGELLRLDS